MRKLIKLFQIIFQKGTNPLILSDSEIRQLSPLDAMKLIYKDFRERKGKDIFFLGAFIIMLIAALKGNLISVPLDRCTNQYAFSYGKKGWHWNIDLAAQVISRSDTPVEETRYYRFFQNVDCSSYTQLMTFHNPALMQSLPDLPFGSFPWGHFDRDIVIDSSRFYDTPCETLKMWYKNCVKVNDNFINEFHKTVALLQSIRLNGYNLSYSAYQPPTTVVLKNNSGEIRLLNMDGAHRLAILSALGYDRIVVMLDTLRSPPILEDDIENWPYVRSGLISRKDASRLFQLYFIQDGSERAKALNL